MTNKINETTETNNEQLTEELELEVERVQSVKSLKTSLKGGGPICGGTRGCPAER